MRDQGQRRDRKGNREPRSDRPPSQWKTEEKFTSGKMVGEVTSRPGRDGKQYSFTISRQEEREGKEFFSRFWREDDLDHAAKLCNEMKMWAQADQHEQREKEAANG